jgi:hypothetical protein
MKNLTVHHPSPLPAPGPMPRPLTPLETLALSRALMAQGLREPVSLMLLKRLWNLSKA